MKAKSREAKQATRRLYYQRPEVRERENRRRRENRDGSADNLRSKHGMSPAQWAELWDAQDGKCYLCGDDLTSGHDVQIDHDHQCCPQRKSCIYCRRGLACNRCNTAIGLALDDPARLRRMADNLEAAKAAAEARIATRPDQAAFTIDGAA